MEIYGNEVAVVGWVKKMKYGRGMKTTSGRKIEDILKNFPFVLF